MAKTTFATGDALTRKIWEEKIFRDTVKMSYFSRFMGANTDSMVQVKEELTREKGDNITFGIRMRLAGAGVTSNQTLEGNEESLVRNSFSVSLEEYAHAVRDAGPLDRQRAVFSIDDESVQALKDWGAEKIDKLLFDEANLSNSKTFRPGSATSKATLTATDKITPDILSKAKAFALTGGNRTQTPLRPIRVDGRDYYVVLFHPDVMFDMFENAAFLQARREAEVRGDENPIFTGAKAIWNGVVIHEHENIPIFTDGGAGGNVSGADNLFLGAQALVWAWGKRPQIIAEEFDYGREHGYAWCMIAKPKKVVFNAKDYGVIGIQTARTGISDV